MTQLKINMMRFVSKIFLVFVTCSVLLTSCEDWLELKPEDNVVRQDFWKSEQQVEAFVFGLYGKLLTDDLIKRLFLWGEIRGDALDYNFIPFELYKILQGSITPTNSTFKWEAFYSSINQCNILIKYAHEAQEIDVTFTESELKAYEAEAYAIRALLYFYLVRSFGDVPVMLDAVTTDQVDFFIPKSTQEEVMEQILNDLDSARRYIPEDYGNNLHNKGRLNKYGVEALLADVYLWNDNYEDCIEACDVIIDSKKYGLVKGKDWLQEIFIDGNSNESIFELQFAEDKNNPFYDFFKAQNGYFEPSFSLYAFYQSSDVRGDSATYLSSAGTIYKYSVLIPEDGTTRTSDNYYANWIIYRYADILLLKAEALNELGYGSEAIEIVNKIQARANAMIISPDENDFDAIRSLILRERQKEFAYEGKRWYDVLRVAKRDNYAHQSILIDMIESYAPADQVDLIKSKYSDPRSHYFPIYYEELNSNKMLEQNPYYEN